METVSYRYELRRGEQIIATGHLTQEAPLEIGDTLRLGSKHGVVREIGPLRDGKIRLVVQLTPDSAELPEQATMR